jgi:hypothetical protein
VNFKLALLRVGLGEIRILSLNNNSAHVDSVKIAVKQKQTARRSMVRGRGYQPELQISGQPKRFTPKPNQRQLWAGGP